MLDFLGVPEAAEELGVASSRVRALIDEGSLDAEKVSGRWLVSRESVEQRRRHAPGAGRPLVARNAWAALLAASGEQLPSIEPAAAWRIRQALGRDGLAGLRDRLSRRAAPHRYWALPDELGALRDGDEIVLTGSSAARAHALTLVSPDVIDAYLPARRLEMLAAAHGLQTAPAREANVVLRAVPDDAWVLAGRRAAPVAAVAVDLTSYPDSRSQHAGTELIDRLDRERH